MKARQFGHMRRLSTHSIVEGATQAASQICRIGPTGGVDADVRPRVAMWSVMWSVVCSGDGGGSAERFRAYVSNRDSLGGSAGYRAPPTGSPARTAGLLGLFPR